MTDLWRPERDATGVTVRRVFIVHSGNRIDAPDRDEPRFPAEQAEAVAERVGRLFDALRPTGVVSAPAAGADLIVLDQARQRGIPVHVLLPLDPDAFEQASVADHEERWASLYRSVLDHATSDPRSSICRVNRDAEHDWHLAAQDDLLTRAAHLAGDELVVALTIRPPAGEHPQSATDVFADRAGRAGLVVVTVDPRPTSRNAPPD